MQLKFTSRRRRNDRIVVNLASMIDISFLLLFYFMVSTMMGNEESRLSTALQTQSSESGGSAGDFQPQVVEVRLIEGSPAYRLGARVLHDRAALQGAIANLPRDVGVLVKVFDQVPVGFAVQAVQVAHDAGFEKVTYVPAGE